MGSSPVQSKEMLTGIEEFAPAGGGNESVISLERVQVAKGADPLGSVPPPPSLKGMAKAVAERVRGKSPTLFIDKLGERLAYERSGVRLYQALLSKFDASGSFTAGPTRSELVEHLEQEHAHFMLLVNTVTNIGADPTVMTPSADLSAQIGKGAVEVLMDPRTTLAQCLEAMLVIELTDNDCWMALSQLASEAGEDQLSKHFLVALGHEQRHLMRIRAWVAASLELKAALSAAK
ncbi:MAG TPA: ferritin-like domain-containing protein [Polyangiales bacterium]|nr:ferritin-like domain-containing protein [Polyangiales bacterium]